MTIQDVLELMTPQEILDMGEFERAKPILPEKFTTFESVITRRGSIRNLDLLPVKTDVMRAYYNSLSKLVMAAKIVQDFQGRKMFCAENQFPYALPENMIQLIVWVRDRNEPRESIAEFILSEIKSRNFNLANVILFERPTNIETSLVRGTLPQVRHIHFWSVKDER
jgi:hypothetical protein